MILENFEKAQEKVDKYQYTSDIGTDENEIITKKRTVNKLKRYITESESSDEEQTTISKKIPPRPSIILKDNVCNNISKVGAKDKFVPSTSSSVSHNQEVAANTGGEVGEEGSTGNIDNLLLHYGTHYL